MATDPELAVYKAWYQNPIDQSNPHVIIFVETESGAGQSARGNAGRNSWQSAGRRGHVFHVVDSRAAAEISKHVVRLKFRSEIARKLETASYLGCQLIGRVRNSNVVALKNVCQRLSPINIPVSLLDQDKKPDCSTWVDNAIYDLVNANIVDTDPGYRMPTKKVKTDYEDEVDAVFQALAEQRRKEGHKRRGSAASRRTPH